MRKLAILLAFCLVLAGCAPKGEQKPTPTPETPTYTAGYRAVTGWDMGFVAVGTDGRVDLIAADGGVTKLNEHPAAHLNDVAVYQNVPVMVGDEGLMLGYVNGQIVSYSTGTMDYDLLAITVFRDMELVGGTDGTLMVYAAGQWETIEFPAPVGNIVGLAADENRVLAVTDTGLCLASEDGHTFAIHDANTDRENPIAFTDITAVGSTFFATGTCEDGAAAVLTTIYGGVWADRPLDYADGAPFDPTGLQVAGITGVENQAVVACNVGRLLTLPDCLQCNKWQTPGGGTFTDVAYHGGKLAAVGDGFLVTVIEAEAVAQYKVSPETAKGYMENGAVLVDVREEADYAARHIKGAVHIPLAELSQKLPLLVPDRATPVIFYCTKGMRSQTAVEQAREMEYAYVYTLGAMDNWTFEFE